MALPVSLTILRQGEVNIIDLAERGVLIPRSETRVSEAFLHELVAEVAGIAAPGFGRGESPAVIQELQRIGELIFSHLLTEPVRHRLRTTEPCDLYLRLDEQLVHVPWELCYDGEQFLALKFRLGRQVITSAPVRSASTARQEWSPLRVLLIADPTETLPQAEAETERLCHFFSETPGVAVTLMGGSEVRKAPLLAALQSHNIVHFAGHSQYDLRTPSRSGWQLHEDVVTVEELGRLTQPPLLVFSNSCQAGATVAWGASSNYDEQAFGIGSAFLLAGVKNYIGTFWVAHDEESAAFATAFYYSLTAGQSIGKALLQARQTLITQCGWQSLTWASYMLYGDPAFTLLPVTNARPLSLASPTAPSQRAQVMQRKLAAILSADVKGYSRLMGEDEGMTIRTLTAYREVMATLISQHHGRVVDAPGDNLLAEFASAVDAVQCAVEIQHELKVKNVDLPGSRKMEFRIGINVGDVIVEAERLYGDGVNIAARVESLAEGGGICLSGTVYDQVKNKLALGYEYLGEQTVKNIAEPVRVYRIAAEISSPLGGEACPEPSRRSQGERNSKESERRNAKVENKGGYALRLRTVLVAAGLLIVAGVVILLFRSPFITHPSSLVTPGALPLPLKPSVAVLPFVNMSSDPEQEYFSDGMTDTLITDLSKLGGLFVIARNSTFAYKGKAIKHQQVSQELGVRYVVEGSVQKADTWVRINAQLVDATTGHHLWAERYDRELKDIFALQDEITQKVVDALQVKLTAGEQGRVGQVPTDNLEAYDYYLRGMEHVRRFTKDAEAQAQQMFRRAVALDPQFASAYMALGSTYEREWDWQWSVDSRALDQALELTQKAITLNDSLAEAHSLLGIIYAQKGQSEQGLTEGERAIALDPNCADCHAKLAVILLIAERPEEALGLVEKAMRLDPESAVYSSSVLGWAYHELGRYEEAIAAQQRALTRNPNYLYAHAYLARIYNELGRVAEARAEEAEVQRISPNFPLQLLRMTAPKKEIEHAFKRSLTENLKARAYFVGGFNYFFRFTKDANAEAQRLWEQAVTLDPQFAAAHTTLGYTHLFGWVNLWSQDPQTLEQALTQARRAVSLDDSLPQAHNLLGQVYLLKKQPERALVEAERAIALDPNGGDNYATLAAILVYTGRPEEALGVLEKALQLNPRFPVSLLSLIGGAYYLTGRQAEALDALQKALPLNPNYLLTHVYLAVVYSELGREEEVRAEVAEVLRLSPDFSLEAAKQRVPYKDPALAERNLAALRKAGLK